MILQRYAKNREQRLFFIKMCAGKAKNAADATFFSCEIRN